MTDWGSHGAGDDSETLTPFVVWGSGIHFSRHIDVHIEQADLCPLMSYFLGLDYPINSVGRLPIDYLLPVDEDLLQAYLHNARQLLEQVHKQYDILKKRLLIFQSYNLNEENFFERIQKVDGYMNLYQIRDDIKGKNKKLKAEFRILFFYVLDFMNRVALASHYYHTYRSFLLSLFIIIGFLLSICTYFHELNPTEFLLSSTGLLCRVVSILIFILLLIEQPPWTHLLYPALVCVHTWLSIDFAIDWIRKKVFNQITSFAFWLNIFMIAMFLQTCILPFFYRWTMSIGIFLLFIQAIQRWQR